MLQLVMLIVTKSENPYVVNMIIIKFFRGVIEEKIYPSEQDPDIVLREIERIPSQQVQISRFIEIILDYRLFPKPRPLSAASPTL